MLALVQFDDGAVQRSFYGHGAVWPWGHGAIPSHGEVEKYGKMT